jgi:hypothetical protein
VIPDSLGSLTTLTELTITDNLIEVRIINNAFAFNSFHL